MNLATIQRVEEIQPIENSDNLEHIRVLGWWIVGRKGEFKLNDKIVYCQIDSVLPDKPEFEFLRSKKFRIKTIKLRGAISQGIIFNIVYVLHTTDTGKYGIGQDVSEQIGIIKYEKPDNNPIRESKPKRPTTFFARLKYDFK